MAVKYEVDIRVTIEAESDLKAISIGDKCQEILLCDRELFDYLTDIEILDVFMPDDPEE